MSSSHSSPFLHPLVCHSSASENHVISWLYGDPICCWDNTAPGHVRFACHHAHLHAIHSGTACTRPFSGHQTQMYHCNNSFTKSCSHRQSITGSRWNDHDGMMQFSQRILVLTTAEPMLCWQAKRRISWLPFDQLFERLVVCRAVNRTEIFTGICEQKTGSTRPVSCFRTWAEIESSPSVCVCVRWYAR